MGMSSSGLSVYLLGSLDVRIDGVSVPVPRGKSAVALAMLALSAGQPVTSTAIEDHLWRHRFPERIRGSLHSHVMRLRRVLGPGSIRTVASGYVLDIHPNQVDVLRFRRLVSEAAQLADVDEARHRLDEALRLWRGEPLAGVMSEAFDHDQIPLLVEERLAALQRRIALDLGAGRHADVITELRELTGRHSLREPLWHQLITALAGCGRQAEAMEAYHQLRVRLRDDLGIDPSADLQALYRRLLAGEPVADNRARRAEPGLDDTEPLVGLRPPLPACPQQLPPDLDRFVGRPDELATLNELLLEQPPSSYGSLVVALIGTAGVGKTALAVHWSHRVSDQFRGGQVYADLHGYDSTAPTQPAAVLETFLRALGTPPERIPSDADARAALFRTITTGRRLIIVADNVHDADQVRPLLPGPGNLLLVTSRSQLRGLTIHDGANRVVVTRLPTADAALLLGRMLGTTRTMAQEDAVVELAELCARLPLALTIVAEYAIRHSGVPLADVVEDLRDEQSRFDSLATGEDAATDLRTVFSGSYRHLDPEIARMFRLLSLHPGAGEISLHAAAALAGLTTHRARVQLDRLVAVNLIEQPQRDRYALHDLLGAYAAEKAQEEEPERERDAATNRILDWYIHSAAAAVTLQWYGGTRHRPIDLPPIDPQVTQFAFASDQSAREWLEAHRSTLVAAAARAADHRLDARASLVTEVAGRFLLHGSHWDDLTQVIEVGLPVARRRADVAAEADLLRSLGVAKAALREYPIAVAQLQESLMLSRATGSRHGEAQCLCDLSNVHLSMACFDEAIAYARRSREVCLSLGDRILEANSLNAMASTLIHVGEQQAAIAACHEALAVLAQSDDPAVVGARGHVLHSLGQAREALGECQEAIELYRYALAAIREVADWRGEGIIRLSLGRALRHAADPDGALANLQYALALLAPTHDPLAEDVAIELAALDMTEQSGSDILPVSA
jgi:DNA-binding SARP family transcriptional activator